MAKITINEISQNYLWSVGSSTFATVALPITAAWGPGYMEPSLLGDDVDASTVLEGTTFKHFPSTQAGLESFIATYRGPASNYRLAKDYSFQMAQTLLAAGYDVLTCRLAPGVKAEGAFTEKLPEATPPVTPPVGGAGKAADGAGATGDGTTETATPTAPTTPDPSTTPTPRKLTLKAKYPGTFGNTLRVVIKKVPNRNYYNAVTYVKDAAGTKTAVENIIFVFDIDDSTDTILHIDEVESNFFDFVNDGFTSDDVQFTTEYIDLAGGADKAPLAETDTAETLLKAAQAKAKVRYDDANADYVKAFDALITAAASFDITKAAIIDYKEWLYNSAINVYSLLTDKLSYSPQRIISPGWDDQNFSELTGEIYKDRFSRLSPMHEVLMKVAYQSRCATALLDVPKSLGRQYVHNESENENEVGYAQMLARYVPASSDLDVNSGLFSSHSALCAPWATYSYVGTTRKAPASPSFLTLMIQRAMILNQATQYEWALPTKRTHNLDIGKPDYTITKKQLDEWQALEGVGVNIITDVPDLGATLWGNSTLFEVPPATYQALANLSTRYLVNAVENQIYRCGTQVTFSYNNGNAYSSFYAGLTPLLDNMKTVGAITGYKMRMSADIDANARVNANTILGKLWLTIEGVVNDISMDLIALPPTASLETLG